MPSSILEQLRVAESDGGDGAVGGFDSSAKGKSGSVPRNLRPKIEISSEDLTDV